MMEVRFAIVFILTAVFTRTVCKVQFSVPEYAMQGNTATLECRIYPFSTSIDSAIVVREIGTKNSPQIETLATQSGRHSDAPSNIHVLISVLTDGTRDVFRILVSISNVQKNDASTYSCSAGRQLPTGYVKKGTKSSYLVILYMPSGIYPACSSTPRPNNGSLQLKQEIGDTLRLSCTSEQGNPRVNLIWGRTGMGILPDPVETVSKSGIRSDITITLAASDNDAQFVCITKSGAFPEYAASCLIGPVVLPVPESTQSISNDSLDSSSDDQQMTTNSSSTPDGGGLFSMFLTSLDSPIFFGSIVAGGALILIILTTCVVFCMCRCCICCKSKHDKETQVEDPTSSAKAEISLVMTDRKQSIRNSKDNLTECQPYAACTLTGIPPGGDPECNKDVEAASKMIAPNGVILRSKVSLMRRTRPLTKDYPPPPDYPRPSKSLRRSEYRLSSIDRLHGLGGIAKYGNIKGIKGNNRESPAYPGRPTPRCRLSLQHDAFTGGKTPDSVAYSNLCSLTMKTLQPPPASEDLHDGEGDDHRPSPLETSASDENTVVNSSFVDSKKDESYETPYQNTVVNSSFVDSMKDESPYKNTVVKSSVVDSKKDEPNETPYQNTVVNSSVVDSQKDAVNRNNLKNTNKRNTIMGSPTPIRPNIAPPPPPAEDSLSQMSGQSSSNDLDKDDPSMDMEPKNNINNVSYPNISHLTNGSSSVGSLDDL